MHPRDGRVGRTTHRPALRPEVHLPRYFLSGKDAPFAVAALFALEAPIGLLAAIPVASTTHCVPFVQARNVPSSSKKFELAALKLPLSCAENASASVSEPGEKSVAPP